MDKDIISSIRILPNNKATFGTESEFRFFIENTLPNRGGEYRFPHLMMNCSKNSLVLFQYDGMIRAVGILVDLKKIPVTDENGVEYAGYYKFAPNTLLYLTTPIDQSMLKTAYPDFKGFNQVKQIIPLSYFDAIYELINRAVEDKQNQDLSIIEEIENGGLMGEEKEAFVKVRINQGVFRERLLRKYSKCCLCGVCASDFLIASHIKPWAMSNSNEKLDSENGLLLCPNHDKLFDSGWISFSDEGNILVSPALQQNERIFMNVHEEMKILMSEEKRRYMEFHRENIYKQ